MRRVGKGCSGIETSLFENMLQVREEIADDVSQPTSPLLPSHIVPPSPPHQLPRTYPSQAVEGTSILVQQVLDKCSALVHRAFEESWHFLSIESSEDEENVFNQGRISVDIDEGIELVDDQEKDAQVKGRQADTQAEIYNIDLDHTSKVIPAAEPVVVAVSTPISAIKPKVLKVVPAALTVSTRKRKGVVIRDPEEELHDDTPAETQSAKDKGKGILVEDPKPMKKKDQIAKDAEYARKLQEEEESLAQTKDAQTIDVQSKAH
nr:hypothetical protein [Tanacetum cinerariifolium]